MMGRYPDPTLDQRDIVIGVLTAGMVNQQIVRHFQACECTISSLRTKICQMGCVKNHIMPIDHERHTRREDIDNVTSFRCNRFTSRTRMPGFVRNATGIRTCAKTDQKRLKGVRLH